MIERCILTLCAWVGSAAVVYGVSEVSRSVIASGVGLSTGQVHAIQATVGQDVVGTASSEHHFIAGGFWVPTLDLFDFANFQECLTGPDGGPISTECRAADSDGDGDVDLSDMAAVQLEFTG